MPVEPGTDGARDRAATIKDVAAHAHVAVGTVSNALNHPDSVSPATRARVAAAIAELGYTPHEPARQLRAGRSRVIALVVPDLANPFFNDVAAGADDAADAHDAMVVVSSSASSADREARHLTRLARQRLLGLAITPISEPPWALLEEVQRHGTPVVLIDHTPDPERSAAVVTVDDHLGGRLVGEHLLSTGHQRITFLAPVFQQTRAREAGLREAVGERASIQVVRCPAMTMASGLDAAEQLLDPSRGGPTAVFAGNDLIAAGLIAGLQRRGLRVPEDVAVIGYDDVDLAAATAVPITTVRQPRHELGARAVARLLTAADVQSLDPLVSVLPPELVQRASSRRDVGCAEPRTPNQRAAHS